MRDLFDVDKKRLAWAIRRGMLELDLIFLPFLENHYDQLNDEEQALFQKLLECEDQDMFKWFLASESPEDPEINKIVQIIRAANQKT